MVGELMHESETEPGHPAPSSCWIGGTDPDSRNRPVGGSWRMDETYIKVKGVSKYLYRAVDKDAKTVDFLLPARRDMAAAKRFFDKALQTNRDPEKVATDRFAHELVLQCRRRLPLLTLRRLLDQARPTLAGSHEACVAMGLCPCRPMIALRPCRNGAPTPTP